jgi:hypothetical protein
MTTCYLMLNFCRKKVSSFNFLHYSLRLINEQRKEFNMKEVKKFDVAEAIASILSKAYKQELSKRIKEGIAKNKKKSNENH